MTVYEPIIVNGEIIGILYAGVKEKNLADGDLTEILERRSSDELGDMSDDINLLTESLSTIIREINDITIALENTSLDLNTVSGQIADGSEQNVEKANGVPEFSIVEIEREDGDIQDRHYISINLINLWKSPYTK